MMRREEKSDGERDLKIDSAKKCVTQLDREENNF